MNPRDCRGASERPRIHMLAAESDLVADLALSAEHRHPVVAAMLLEEIERAELHDSETMDSIPSVRFSSSSPRMRLQPVPSIMTSSP